MFITVDSSGKITGRYNSKQPGLNCIEVERSDLESVQFPKWDKVKKQIANDANAQAVFDSGEAYGYARARGQAYVKAYSKDPKPNQMDAIGHVLDAILSHLAGDSSALDAIQTKRAEIKAAHPKA